MSEQPAALSVPHGLVVLRRHYVILHFGVLDRLKLVPVAYQFLIQFVF